MRTGIDILRLMVRNFDNCREDFNQQFSVGELVEIHAAWLASGWDIYPDRWEAKQVAEALEGIAPDWDDNERPVYAKDRRTARLVSDTDR